MEFKNIYFIFYTAYMNSWCKAERVRRPRNAELNTAITERIGYARKQLKN